MRATKKQGHKEPRRLMAEAESAFGKRQWAPAGEGFAAAHRARADLAEKLASRRRDDRRDARASRRLRQIAVAAGALLAVGAGVVAVTMWGGGEGEAPVRELACRRRRSGRRRSRKPPPEKDASRPSSSRAKPPAVEQPAKPAEQPKSAGGRAPRARAFGGIRLARKYR